MTVPQEAVREIISRIWPSKTSSPELEINQERENASCVLRLQGKQVAEPTVEIRIDTMSDRSGAPVGSAAFYLNGWGPLEFVIGGRRDESAAFMTLLRAVRDGRIRAVGWERDGIFVVERLELVDPIGTKEAFVLPTQVPLVRRKGTRSSVTLSALCD